MTRVPLAALVLCIATVLQADNRMKIQGRDVLLDGAPHFPHGMIHIPVEEYGALQKIGVNSLSIDLGWNQYDPKKSDAENAKAYEGVLKFADEAHKKGMTVLWLFSFHYTPEWLWQRYPDVHAKKYDGSDGHGIWIDMCLDHPGFRKEAERWLTFMAKLLNPHPATIGYILWNEPNLSADIDYNPHTVAAFHGWLERRYKTIEAVNTAWGTAFKSFSEVKAPAPRNANVIFGLYDQMSNKTSSAPTTQTAVENSAIWMDWMRFRQENFAAYWKWEADVLRKVDASKIITSKIVPFDLYSSHAYGAGTNTELWVNTFLDVLGMDLYSHMDDDFLGRWKCDYFYSMSQGKPVWHTEMNFSWCKERGIATPEQWRVGWYYQVARGVSGIWDFMWADGPEWTLHYKGYKFAPVTYEMGKISKQMQKLAPVLSGMKPAAAQVAVLHSTTTGLALPGDYAPTADQSTLVELLYRSQTPFEFITEDMIRKGELKKYRVLIAAGTAALPGDVIEGIRKFADENGGHVLASARFGELDEFARVRADRALPWLGVKVTGMHREAREKTGTMEFSREARTVEDKPITAKIKMDTWSSRPIKFADGTATGSGAIYGNPDTQYDWSCNGRHELYWEDLETIGDGKAIGTFADGKPAIVRTPQTIYIARDICWVDSTFEQFFRSFLKQSGVKNRSEVVLKSSGQPAPSVDVRMLEGNGKRVLFVINSVRTLSYDGQPVEVKVVFDSSGEVTDALTGKIVPSRWENGKRVMFMTLASGEVRVLAGKPYPSEGWESVHEQYKEIARFVKPLKKKF